MRLKVIAKLCCFCFFFFLFASLNISDASSYRFIPSRKGLERYQNCSDAIVIASPGRSGSTLLTDIIYQSKTTRPILKTHVLPISSAFKGKILFIFSDPDLAAESALHMTISDAAFGAAHFQHLEGSDKGWLAQIGDTTRQTLHDNLLCYDALGCGEQLRQWLQAQTKPCSSKHAQILAIKYENLWDPETEEVIKSFLDLDTISIPPRRPRGYDGDRISQLEAAFREKYNLGSKEKPRYAAYDQARAIWEAAPPFQFLKLRN